MSFIVDELQTLPDVGHIGYIIDNMDSNCEWFGKFLKIDNFYIYDFTPINAWVDGAKIDNCKFKIGIGTMPGGKKIELIQPLIGESTPHMIFLKEKNSNIHHIAFYVKDYLYWKNYFAEFLGAKIIFEAEAEDNVIGYRRSFYAQPLNAAGVVEISELPWKRK